MKISRFWFVFVLVVLLVSSGQPVFAASSEAPVFQGDAAKRIAGQYIVVFKDSVNDLDVNTALSAASGASGFKELHRYSKAVKGFAAKLDAATVASLRKNPNVKYIEQDQIITIDATQSGAT